MRLTKPEAITVSICDSETTPIKIKFDNENKNIGLTPELAYSVGLSLINTVETFRAKEAARYEKERKNSDLIRRIIETTSQSRVVTFAGRIGEAN